MSIIRSSFKANPLSFSLQRRESKLPLRQSPKAEIKRNRSAMNTETRPLRGLTEIYRYLRRNKTPIYVIMPTPFNLMGLDQWVGGLEFVNYFDIFDGRHPRIVLPTQAEPQDFKSMEDVGNYLVDHPEFRDRVKSQPPGLALFVQFDAQTEALCEDIGLTIALPSDALRNRLDSKIETTRLGNEAGVPSAPNIMGEANTYGELSKLAERAGLGKDLVVQTPYGDSGRTTFFIKSQDDWDAVSGKIIGQHLKIMKRLNHLPGTIEGCATRHGTLVGPVMTDITGFEEITPYKGGWCGNDISPSILPDEVPEKVRDMARKFGDRLYQEGYKGVFCIDFLLDTDTGEVYLGELNPRISGASPPTNLITSTYGGCPLFLFHLLEFMDVEYEIDITEVQSRWNHYDHWTQLILKQTEDKVELITKAPQSGLWKMDEDGHITFLRASYNINAIGDETEAFYLRVYGVGEYCYHGADLGCLLARGRMQSDDRELLERAQKWNKAIKAEFQSVPLSPNSHPTLPVNMTAGKWF
ncbi:biotin carboxylase [Phaeobacter gallaeciensis]|uniref:Biotin carboxylase n=2 Tax=Roseobacteraceae TaxID=2854170 RepID=A0A366XD04_9RHOB|nr:MULTISPECIES: biotin carboxylase [Roseobacteraceae]MBT3143904.1 biotin carboxylase [Falsiruegeria litorea]MBT8168933.1 biotin carboxylase [Falsiruegeria litorea]RBW62680.1 biotin carboxylase [Phaeobacter gallaeciensis]